MTAGTPDSFDSPDGRTYSGPVTAGTPGQAVRAAIEAAVSRAVTENRSCGGSVPCGFCAKRIEAAMATIDAALAARAWSEMSAIERKLEIALTALDEIHVANPAGTHSHDTAHAAMDRMSALQSEPKPAPGDDAGYELDSADIGPGWREEAAELESAPGGRATPGQALRETLAALGWSVPPWESMPPGEREGLEGAAAPALAAIARACHEANRALQVAAGDPCPSLPWEQEPEEARRFAVAAVELAARGGTAEEQFLAWRQGKQDAGWSYGPVKDPRLRTHPCMVASYAELPERERVKDAVFAAIVRAMTAGGTAAGD